MDPSGQKSEWQQLLYSDMEKKWSKKQLELLSRISREPCLNVIIIDNQLDSICGFCGRSVETKSACVVLPDSSQFNDDKETIDNYGFEAGKVYLASEIEEIVRNRFRK